MIDRVRQRGLTMFSFLIVAMVVVFSALLAMKLIPAYMEFFTIKKILSDIGSKPEIRTMSNMDIRTAYGKRAMIDNITTVQPTDLEIERQNGVSVVSVNYIYQTPLVGNVSLLVEFKASSGDASSAPPSIE